MKLYYNSDNRITVTVTDEAGALVTGATVNGTLVDLEGNEVAGATWPVALAEGDPGKYSVVLSQLLQVQKYQRLKFNVTAVSGTWDAYSEIPVQVAVDKT